MATKSINSKRFLELVERLDRQKHGMPGMEPMIELFNELGQLVHKFQEAKENEEREVLWAAANACNEKLQTTFAELCKSWGVSVEELQTMLEDPKNYTAEEWREAQEIKHEAHSVIEEVGTRPRSSAKHRKPRKWA